MTRIWILLALGVAAIEAQGLDPKAWQEMKWRMIGPFRAGRTVGAVGLPQEPNTFFIGVNHGGVWKTTDAGRTWKPIFDDQPTGSIGDLAVSESDPKVIYVGSGEGLQRPDLSVGDGIYKTTDGGRTWRNMGLRDAQQIGRVIVDYKNPNRVFVAAMGHPYGPNEERGIYRSLDGGESWKRVLYRDADTGATQIEFDSKDPNTLYAALWAGRQGPWENGAWQGPGSGLFKSTDGGETWKQLTQGLPTIAQGLGRIGFDIAPGNAKVLYAVVDANGQYGGVYRSDDAGESWRQVSRDGRTWGRGSDFAEIRIHPKDAETVFVANTASYISKDGGKTFTAFKGAPGGDDYHRIWIHWEKPEIMLFATDQGATVTVNGGETWSSWYNQPTAQFYHVTTDNRFPYWVYGGQQESGSAGVASRGDYGAITARDWQTVGIDEYGYVAVDPLNNDVLYGGKMTRFDRRTGQAQNIAPEAVRGGQYRFLRTAPAVFSMVDKKTLFYAGNVLFKTLNGGQSWQVISPDLSREKTEVPETIGIYRTAELEKMARRGVIYTVAPSFQDLNTIWVGTDDGLIHVTRDGGKVWTNVTPKELTSWSKVSLMEASHFDNQSAYAAVNRFRLDDLRPHIFRTHDGGKTWQRIVNGIPENEVVNAVREDPKRKGLLYAGTERAVYFSIDDGENWQRLRMNMPSTSIRDIVVHEDDLVAGTHGRSFWILDNVTPLRQLSATMQARLFEPQVTYRLRRSLNSDTPLPPEEPVGQNPPDGAMIDYYLPKDASGPVVIEVIDGQGKVIRKYSSEDVPEKVNESALSYPSYWFRPARQVSTTEGMHRWIWNLRHEAPKGFPKSYPISAIYRDTPPGPEGPLALPGTYRVRLTVDGTSFTQPLVLKMDPRVKTPIEGLTRMHSMAVECLLKIEKIRETQKRIAELRGGLEPKASTDELKQLVLRARNLEGAGRGGKNYAALAFECLGLMTAVDQADAAPTAQQAAALVAIAKTEQDLDAAWRLLEPELVKQVKP